MGKCSIRVVVSQSSSLSLYHYVLLVRIHRLHLSRYSILILQVRIHIVISIHVCNYYNNTPHPACANASVQFVYRKISTKHGNNTLKSTKKRRADQTGSIHHISNLHWHVPPFLIRSSTPTRGGSRNVKGGESKLLMYLT